MGTGNELRPKLRSIKGEKDPSQGPEEVEPPRNAMHSSICKALRSEPLCRMVVGDWPLWWDEMQLCVRAGLPDGEEMTEARTLRVLEAMQDSFVSEKGPIHFRADSLMRAVYQLGHERPRHLVAEWLRKLVWDKTERIHGVPEWCLNCEQDEFTSLLLRKWFISAVARALSPGCKADTCLILSGPQGVGKSQFFKTLAGDAWFNDTAFDLRNTQVSAMSLRGSWIVEWAELQQSMRSEAETVKAFLSSSTDRIKLPYGHSLVTLPRTSVIVGTTNEEEFLNDPTGNRRSWVIRVGSRGVPIAMLERDREQLWAEAVYYYLGGEPWWLDSTASVELRRTQKQHERTDPWEQELAGWLLGKDEVTMDGALIEVGKPKGQWEYRDARRAGSILKKLGWGKKRIRDGEKLGYAWRRNDS